MAKDCSICERSSCIAFRGKRAKTQRIVNDCPDYVKPRVMRTSILEQLFMKGKSELVVALLEKFNLKISEKDGRWELLPI